MRRLIMVAAAAALIAGSVQARTVSPRDKVRAWRQAHEQQIYADYVHFLAMPNVATTQADVDANAAYIQQLLEARGFRTKLLRAAPGTPPSVFAELDVPGAKRTVLYYGHYDGQSINQKGWLNPPFEPTLRTAPPASALVDPAAAKAKLDPDWRIYARGAGDDKVTIQALISAFDALKAAKIKPSVNIKLIYEGEEEHGSPHFAEIIHQNLDLLKADLLIMGDGPLHQSGKQQINGGNRGLVGFAATVYGPTRPLHDGHYGNWAPSPAVMLADLVMSLRDEQGHILIPGIYDDVAPLTDADRAALAALPPVEADLKKEMGLGRNIGGERLADGYLSPTFNIRAIHAGDDGANATNAIASEGTLSVDIRLVPGEVPDRVRKLTEDYLVSKGWTIVRDAPDAAMRLAHPKIIRLVWDEGDAAAVKTALDTPSALAVAASIGRTAGYPVIKLPIMGGSTPMDKVVAQLKLPMVGVNIANYDDNQHARNENLRIGNLWDGIEVYAGLLADLDW